MNTDLEGHRAKVNKLERELEENRKVWAKTLYHQRYNQLDFLEAELTDKGTPSLY